MRNRFLNLLRFINKCWKSPLLKINSKIVYLQQNSPIVLPCYERPDNFPPCMPFLREQELVSIHWVVLCNIELVQLIASVKKCLPLLLVAVYPMK